MSAADAYSEVMRIRLDDISSFSLWRHGSMLWLTVSSIETATVRMTPWLLEELLVLYGKAKEILDDPSC